MKKLMMALLIVGSMMAHADEPQAKAPEAQPHPTDRKMDEGVQKLMKARGERMAQREKLMAERRAALENKSIEIVKKYGLNDEQAKALLKELREARKLPRRPMKEQKAPAEAEKKAE